MNETLTITAGVVYAYELYYDTSLDSLTVYASVNRTDLIALDNLFNDDGS